MDRTLVGGIATLIISLFVGCGDSRPASTESTTSSPGQQPALGANSASSEADEPILRAAGGFLEAVFQGDSQSAIGWLTPLAVQRIRQSNQAFAPPGLDTASFSLGQLRKPSSDRAIVQCIVTPTGQKQEEMCCMLRLVDGQWRVSGIAFQVSHDKRPFILDFEKPQRSGPTQDQMVDQLPTTAPSGESSVPGTVRTAQESPYGAPRETAR